MTTTKRKFGKKNVIKVDPLAYNVGLIGESGIGKTTLMKEVCEKLAGEDGYMILNIGKEDGVDAIAGASYEDIPDFETLIELTEDIVDNRENYADLKVVVIDTSDELFTIIEPYVIKLHNRLHPDKRVTSINQAFGGFGKGADKAIELILEEMWKLKKVGVSVWVVGHTKRKSVNDLYTGEEYDTLTSNMANKYFTSIKTKLHFLGLASVERNIEKQRIKQKVGNDKVVGKVLDESRTITFRDDNVAIDSKSRFAKIVDKIPLDADEFIKALTDAITVEHNKQSGVKTIEETKVEQDQQKEAVIAEQVSELKSVNPKRNKELAEVVKAKFPDADANVKAQVKELLTVNEIKLGSPEDAKTEVFETIVALLA